MKGLLALLANGLALSASCCAQHCPDLKGREATIGGASINGPVGLHHRLLKFAKVTIISSNGQIAWVGRTSSEGGLYSPDLRPDTYRLVVQGWGRTTVRIDPSLTKDSNGQTIFYSVLLSGNECVSTITVTN
jgi:hypothetical protein